MGAKILGFLENHAEKIVLVIVGLICLWLLATRVAWSPNRVEYKGKMYGPGSIDRAISKEVQDQLEGELNQPADPIDPCEPVLARLAKLYQCSLTGVNTKVAPPIPKTTSADMIAGREYKLPKIPDVNGVAAEHFRAVAYVPEDGPLVDTPYKDAKVEPNDIDFVTVQGDIDLVRLHKEFYESFAGDMVQLDWRDPCLARPIFGAVELERRQLRANGSWSDWTRVPRAKIDHRAELFEIIEDVENLPPGGLKVRMLQYQDMAVQADLLQPPSYDIASAREEWLPPRIHKQFASLMEQELREERREAKEEEIEQRQKERELRERLSSGRGRTDDIYGGYGEGDYSATGGRDRRRRGTGGYDRRDTQRGRTGGRRDRTDRTNRRDRRDTSRTNETRTTTSTLLNRQESSKPTMASLRTEYNSKLINPFTDFRKVEENLIFWAHDDTVEPGNTYQYRIRVGVFNPIAGTNQFSEQDADKKDEVLLWSGYSDVSEPVEIPQRVYLFAMDVQQADKSVSVQVAKYYMGYWRSEMFKVRQGESIGEEVEVERDRRRSMLDEMESQYGGYGRTTPVTPGGLGATSGRGGGGYYGEYEGIMENDVSRLSDPDVIDYDTGAVMVDVVQVSDWTTGPNMRQRRYFDMLYSFDGADIDRMPVGTSYWSRDMQLAQARVQRKQLIPVEPLRDRGTNASGGSKQRTTPAYDPAMQEYMMQMEAEGLY